MSPLAQTPELALKLFRKYRLQRQPDSVIAPEIVPVILLEDLSRYGTSGIRECMGAAFVTAGGVGTFGISAITNNLQEAIRVTDLWLLSGAGAQIELTLVRPTAGLTGLVANVNTSFTDFTVPGRPSAGLSTATPAAFPAGRSLWDFNVPSDTSADARPVHVPLNIELFGGAPGDAGPGGPGSRSLFVGDPNGNLSFFTAWRWVEGSPQG